MKYSILLAALLSFSSALNAYSFFGLGEDKTETELENVKMELAQANTIIEQQNSNMAQTQNVTEVAEVQEVSEDSDEQVLGKDRSMVISVTGQGVAPMSTVSPAQAYALAKRAAIADAYRAIAEKVKGVRIDGQDLIKNMMVKRSTIRTSVKAMVRNANVVETTFKEGLCEVEMEIIISHSDFAQ